MAVVFVLGPSEWDPARGTPPAYPPMEMRRRIATAFSNAGHSTIVMEDEPDRFGDDLVDKFEGVLGARGVTDVIVYWPRGAKMQTTFDELIMLRHRPEQVRPNVWILHDRDVASIDVDSFRVLEPGGRSRYLTALGRLPLRAVPWDDLDDLMHKARRVAGQLA